jgi:putative NADH-flavin reductase
VRAFARSASRLDLEHEQLEKYDGDALDEACLQAALQDVEAVVLTLGIKLRPGTVMGGTTLFSQATEKLLPAMESAGVHRLLTVTGYGAGDSGKTMNAFNRVGFNAVFARIYADKSKQEALIKDSNLKWTIVRPVVLTGGSCRDYNVLARPEEFRMGMISRACVADFLIDEIEDNKYVRKAPVLN